MRNAFLFLLAPVIFMFGSCEDWSTPPNGAYDSMQFERTGGGSLTFNVSLSKQVDTVQIAVTYCDNRDTAIHMAISRNAISATTFEALQNALSGQHQITGDFKQSSMLTGTWARVYMVKGGHKEEVTNTELRKNLVEFEQIVLARL